MITVEVTVEYINLFKAFCAIISHVKNKTKQKQREVLYTGMKERYYNTKNKNKK